MTFRLPLCLLTICCTLVAVEAAGAQPAPRKSDDPDRVTCETDHPVGSRLGGVRHCRTQAEWQQYRAEMRDVVHRIQTQGATACDPQRNQPC